MSPPQVLYVGGWGRSGSTLLSHLLGRLPEMVAVGELRYVWQAGVSGNELCGCGEPFDECPFWVAVGQEAFGGWDKIDLDEVLGLEAAVLRHSRIPMLAAPRLFPAHAERLRRYTDITRNLYSAIAAVADARVVVDSTKNPPVRVFPAPIRSGRPAGGASRPRQPWRGVLVDEEGGAARGHQW